MANKAGHKLKLKEFNILFESTYVSLCHFANAYVKDFEKSKDLVQDVFVKVWEDNIEFDSVDGIKPYLYTSVRNKSLDHLKSRSFKMMSSLTDYDMETLESERFFMREVVIQETSEILEKAIDTLPKKCAQIIKLSRSGMTNATIAEIMGLSINTIKTQKKIAYKRLKPILKAHFLWIAYVFVNS